MSPMSTWNEYSEILIQTFVHSISQFGVFVFTTIRSTCLLPAFTVESIKIVWARSRAP